MANQMLSTVKTHLNPNKKRSTFMELPGAPDCMYLRACALDARRGIVCSLVEFLQYIEWQRSPRILSFCLKSSTFFACESDHHEKSN